MKTKHPLARIQIIDRELSKNRFVKTKDLEKYIAEETLPVTRRTIQKDIELMKEDRPVGFSAPIEFNKKEKAYYYSDSNFTIQAFGLKPEDIMALSFYTKTLEQYKGYKIFENIIKAIEKVVDNINVTYQTKKIIEKKSLLLTEKILAIKGIDFIDPILKAIIAEQEIRFDYKKFDDDVVKSRTLAPLLLKEDKNFWYVIGVLTDKKRITTFALDRISNLVVTNNYYKAVKFDIEEYFKYSFGITVSNDKPRKTVLSFTPNQGKYIKAVPIHGTQEIIRDNNKELRISVMVKPSYEFYSKILSYGNDVKVISPKSILNEIHTILKRACLNYQ